MKLKTTSSQKPRDLGLNGSFAVFKVIETDVVGFENFLQSNEDKIDPELLVAKMRGRWRNGVPLMLSPETDRPKWLRGGTSATPCFLNLRNPKSNPSKFIE